MKKHISEMSDEELDDFLKKLSGSQEIPFQAQDWENMKSRLDQRNPAPLNGYRYGFLAVFLALVFLIGFWWINPISDLTGINNKPMEVETLFPSNPSSSNLDFQQPNLKENQNKSIPDLQTDQKRVQTKSTLPVIQNHKLVNKNKSARRYVVPIAFENTLINNKKSLIDRIRFPEKDQLRYKTNSRSIPTGPITKKKIFSIALMVAPDISAVQFTQIQRAGRSMAINLEYFIHPRWSVNSGLVHGYKTYTSQEGYWPGYANKHQELKGNCWVLEIPVNLRYYPIQGLKSNWYLSSGVSSYFMIKEQYSLLQAGNIGYPYSDEIEIKGSNMHLFGVLNLGFGYERKLNQHLSLQVEPYFRLPFGGIGEGEINLKSAGILMGLKYYR